MKNNDQLVPNSSKTTGPVASRREWKLPPPEPTVFAYEPITVHERIAYIAGQIPKHQGKLAYCGLVGSGVSFEEAKAAAQICAEQALAWLNRSAGGLDNIERILRLKCFVAHAEGFTQISEVADAASILLVEYFGDAGRHSRSVIGVRSLPRNAPVLVEITAALCSEPT
ncbi:MAG: RidA family protein [Roseibium album]|uniref:Endoribonuclease L-PSP n=1 Tax=Roseibium album TaxID=311410 RepID=A0A0M7AMU9_9HYPH|nr:RidA family protein [Roseibium album]MBG6146764.1 enamine deaminase RidA (YjgF/YER057c/UK114 family) [Labrenzia sp. EL_142]MBG6155830.1 enamine deaminase RidA (YjgF/YER057c/UK114 family) [Labrenzia sp. EL_162]MBG6161285.1 enamine deaminase RidA (YjgF/YER057c/UK114 family) [Labrenzia sp. EL_195]MBG6177188.1 enamine deaminase RidA (YjgF/YER057c/UK114 family) [Labrenzia sp. EL_132]MBG6194364.1 enamine deaminase RidA (YjgF/YER057c/UK114 family) [Labrenzia sp. EL_159]MBG6200703.1 enamine deamin